MIDQWPLLFRVYSLRELLLKLNFPSLQCRYSWSNLNFTGNKFMFFGLLLTYVGSMQVNLGGFVEQEL